MYLYLLSNSFTAISSLSLIALMFKNLAVSIAYAVLIKVNLFALVLVKAYKLIL
jgi:multidrug transporter EmrE-like cation transporter